MNENDNQMIAVAALCVVLILAMFVARECKAAEPIEVGVHALTKQEAILHMVSPRAKYKPRLPYFSKRIKAYKDEVYRTKLVDAFQMAANQFGLPINLLIAMAYRETVFRTDKTGPGGEKGILQVMPYAIKRCQPHCENLDTAEGGAMCGACWLAKGRDRCGDIRLGINAYVSGRCVPTSISAQKATQNRIWLWQYLDKLTGAE